MKTLVAALVLSLTTCAVSLVCFGADNAPTIVKRDQLPGNLKGGKEKKFNDGIPGCTAGRAKLSSSDATVKEWAATHEKHDCASASTVYVCRAGKNISVRCE